MTEMIATCNMSEVLQLTKSHCDNSLSWLLQREQIRRVLNLGRVNTVDRRQFTKTANAEDFAKLKMLRSIINPFTECLHFFERDDTAISFVLPVLAHLDSFPNTNLRSWIVDTDETYEHCVDLFISVLDERRKKHFDQDLLRAAPMASYWFWKIVALYSWRQAESIRYFDISRRSWTQKKEQRFRIQANRMTQIRIEKRKNRVDFRMNLLLSSTEWKPDQATRMTADLIPDF
jgi:hypothetical protein